MHTDRGNFDTVLNLYDNLNLSNEDDVNLLAEAMEDELNVPYWKAFEVLEGAGHLTTKEEDRKELLDILVDKLG